MDFTREPIIESVITPREGCKLVIRNSKGTGQEEYFVDAVEVITFSQAIFFRSLERPKPFLVPASDYEVLEVREARIVLKNVGMDRSIKIGGGREGPMRPAREPQEEKQEANQEHGSTTAESAGSKTEGARNERKRDRRRQSKRRREVTGQAVDGEEGSQALPIAEDERIEIAPPNLSEVSPDTLSPNAAILSSLLAPPPLISETIGRYKEKFRDAFYTKEEQESKLTLDPEHIPLPSEPVLEPESQLPAISLEQPAFGAFELSEEAEEEIYRQRKRKYLQEESVGELSFSPEENSLSDSGENRDRQERTPEQ